MITKSIHLYCSVERAFELFTKHAGEWWPPERRHTGDATSAIEILSTGRFYERARDGREADLGRVRVWEPPTRLVLDWYPGTDREHPTDVTITFAPDGAGTLVTVEHRPGASGELWDKRNAQFARSWDLVLEALARVPL